VATENWGGGVATENWGAR